MSGIKAVVIRAVLVRLVDDVLGMRGIDPVLFDALFLAIRHIGVDKDAHALGIITQHIVGASSDNHTVLFFGDLLDDLMLQ